MKNTGLAFICGALLTGCSQLADRHIEYQQEVPLSFPVILTGLVIAPRGIPADIQKKAQDAFAAALNSPELKEQFLKQGAVAMSSTPQEYASLMTSEYEKWQQVVARGKITLD